MSKKGKKQPKINYNKQQRLQGQSSAAQATPAAQSARVQREAPKSAAPSPIVSLEPLAPLIVRSGRPFDDQAGADAPRFPPPSTLAGCLRTAWARANDQAFGPKLAELAVASPFLARVDNTGNIVRRLAPKPADAQYFGHDKEARCLRLEPSRFEDGCNADLPDGLRPLRLSETIQGKASKGPAWWDWEDLIAFRQGKTLDHKELTKRGWSPPSGDRRTHVAIDAVTQAAESGRLFQTEGLDLEPDNPTLNQTLKQKQTPDHSASGTLRLLARFAEPLPGGLVHLGGERRLARLHPEPETAWPTPPATWFQDIHTAGGLTLTLLTPGVFQAGYRPGWLDATLTGEPPIAPGVRLRLVAAAVERWQPHSGWDLLKKEPRPTRKLVGAGATYWFRLLEPTTPEALAPLWLASLCDLEQDRRDGFGLALPAPWKID
ncbi:type III-B CRISPR module-associated Cmr3 family protein [Allochromatium vinosum]|uniref:CRISPR-associated protein, Cmr3 n=1 Tax=Allochromatium vinosum (strain ATCC 17899 / DSM 180 / NBRC 103801 / NCIMB 10441 / D) TaxID=572477 RepID=D3RW17_ALLVD|nr:type III-B CRISPR module-associated Cmr3 family protein [Allochromatium vinosum]ADC64029.1 CRISPR-associated protein, Cmr3 [Allochromatium vinosum DSM 180]